MSGRETGNRRNGNRSRQQQQRPPRHYDKKRHPKNHDTNGAGRMTQAWLDAIHDASTIVRPAGGGGGGGGGGGDSRDKQVDASLLYLQSMASTLEKESDWWDQPPTRPPPKKFDSTRQPDTLQDEKKAARPPVDDGSGNNRFATFRDYDDDDDEEEVQKKTTSVSTPSSSGTSKGGLPELSTGRLMIRVVTAQSEVYASQASPPQWKRGAELYALSLAKVHHALQLADSECARWLQNGDIPLPLKEDADVVDVAVQYLTKLLDLFRRKAIRKEAQLAAKLEPQWQKRDQVREAWGEERWIANPNPRRDFAEQRRADEEQLQEIRAALLQLNDINTEEAVLSSRSLQEQVSSSSNLQRKRRYNGTRPRDLSKRVSFEDYPDATNYGWKFTGSWKSVEFFETEDGVKLDWYFTTATIKTSLDHPKQGKTQLFGNKVSPEMYIQILRNPRVHTDARYQEKKKEKKQRDLWEPNA